MRRIASGLPAAMLHRELEHEVNQTNRSMSSRATAAGIGWRTLEARIGRLKAGLTNRGQDAAKAAGDRSRALVVLPAPPAMPIGLAAAALTLSMTSGAAAGPPRHAALDPSQSPDNGLRIVGAAAPVVEPKPTANVANEVVTLTALASAPWSDQGGLRFLAGSAAGAAGDGWSGLFGQAEGLKLVDFAIGNSAIARLVE